MKFRDRQLFLWRMAYVIILTTLLFLFYYLFFHLYDPNSVISEQSPLPYQKSSAIHWPEVTEYSKENYPNYKSLLSNLENWNPDDPNLPLSFNETLQHFNYSDPRERKMAEVYRNAEVPFKLYDIPEVELVRAKWNYKYLSSVLKFEWARVEESKDNHFMFFIEKSFPNWKPPQKVVYSMSFSRWYQLAREADEVKLSSNSTHYYYVLGSRPHDTSSSFIARDLPFFSTQKENFFITRVKDNKGIQCRFGMRGVIAATHYDSGRNMIAMIRGKKRYILTPPESCKHLGIIRDQKHPSYRHSIVDWSDLNEAQRYHFDQVDSIDTIVNEGEILYVPSFWFHYIVSLEYSIQCNSRSGFPANMEGSRAIRRSDCMDQYNK
jgi:hypothetical protein